MYNYLISFVKTAFVSSLNLIIIFGSDNLTDWERLGCVHTCRFWSIMKRWRFCSKWRCLWRVCQVGWTWSLRRRRWEWGQTSWSPHRDAWLIICTTHRRLSSVRSRSSSWTRPTGERRLRAYSSDLLRVWLLVYMCVFGSGCWTSTSRSRWRRSSGCVPFRDRPCCSQPPWARRWCCHLLDLIPLQFMCMDALCVQCWEIRLL